MGRRLGQHFLRDVAILDRIVDAIAPAADDTVLEIGPGDGTLTMRLLRRVARVVAIERDPGLAAGLHGRDRLTVVAGDALEVPWPERTKVIGNVPYYITTPLIEKALTPPARPVTVFLVQKEVADRVVALPGGKAYGALSVGVQAVALAERLFVIRAGAFHPPPKVDSAVLRLIPRAEPLVADAERPPFRRFVTGLFGQRRKQLGRSLRAIANLDRDEAAALLRGLGILPQARPEVLPPEALVRLFRAAMR